MSNISIDQLGDAIMAQLNTFEKNVREGMKKAVNETMDEMVKETQGSAQSRRGRYKGSITSTVLNNSMMSYSRVWHAKKPGTGLAHLLNNGHRFRNGGSYPGNNHVGNAEARAVETFQRKLEEVIHDAGSEN